VPAKPGAWLTTVARRRALDLLRREVTLRRALPLLVDDEPAAAAGGPFPDDRLRLVFTCCHPSLAMEAQVALTLRLLCGLSTAEVARAFLVTEPTMAARITRAKKKIATARIRTGCRRWSTFPNAPRPCWPWCTCCSRPGTPRRSVPT
jgi:RNA polymerase sigma-70 factor (ECF subfamily)